MTNWYGSRERMKRAAQINGTTQDARVDRLLESVSRTIDKLTHRFFIPKTETRLYRWPRHQTSRATILWLDAGLISVSTLQTRAQDSSPTTISASDFFLEPINYGPPFNRIEIDESSSAAFESGNTQQRSISVAGSWGYAEDTRSAGTVDGNGLGMTTATEFVCSDASLIDVGDTLLIESEQLFVSERVLAALGSILIDGALTADISEVTVTVDSSHGLNAGEVIQVNSEKMFIESIATNDLTVVRSYDGSVLAAHNNDTAVQVFRTLTVERGVNGTTAATHADTTAISVYEPPLDITELALAEALAAFHQEQSGWGRTIGTGEGATELGGRALGDLRERVVKHYRRMREAAI